MRKLLIKQSLKHAPGYGLRWHIGRVKFMEDVWGRLCLRASL
jgi:hypothetical protein